MLELHNGKGASRQIMMISSPVLLQRICQLPTHSLEALPDSGLYPTPVLLAITVNM